MGVHAGPRRRLIGAVLKRSRAAAVAAALAGVLLAPSAALADGTNLIANGSFETNASGWGAWNAALSLATDGTDGAQALRVFNAAGATAFSTYTNPRPVNPTAPGTSYTALAWVRSDTPGHRVCLVVQEMTQAGAVLY